jgi:Peptidase M76 family
LLQLREREIEEAIVHELTHAYDYINGRCDFSTCEGLAYSEVRAAREAECSELSGKYFLFDWQKKQCVRDHAIRSTANLFPKTGEAQVCVDRVLDRALKDDAPGIK